MSTDNTVDNSSIIPSDTLHIDIESAENQIWKPAHCDVKYLEECKGEIISIIGKLVGKPEPNYAVFVACDGKLFTVYYSPHKNIKFKKSYNQIRGIVQQDLSIIHKSHYSISDSFCLWTWNKIIQLMRKYPEIFD